MIVYVFQWFNFNILTNEWIQIFSFEPKATSQFLHPTPKPNPVPSQRGNARRLKNSNEATDPIRNPLPSNNPTKTKININFLHSNKFHNQLYNVNNNVQFEIMLKI